MICKQCKSEVTTDEMALSGYRRQDGKRSRRSICRKCYNLNRFTSCACKNLDLEALDKALPVYKLISANVYGNRTEWIPLSIQSQFYERYPELRPVSTGHSSQPLDVVEDFLNSFKVGKVVTIDAVSPVHSVLQPNDADNTYTTPTNMTPTNTTTAPQHSGPVAPYEGLSKEANLVICRFLEDLTLIGIQDAVRTLYECCCDITKTTSVPSDGQVYSLHPARTDLQFPSDFLDEIYDAAENIFDEESFVLFGQEIYPKDTKVWRTIHLQLMQIFQLTPMKHTYKLSPCE